MMKLTPEEYERQKRRIKAELRQIKRKEIEELIESGEEVMCGNCGTYYEAARAFYELDNGDFVCSKKCLVEYVISEYGVTTIKGRDLVVP